MLGVTLLQEGLVLVAHQVLTMFVQLYCIAPSKICIRWQICCFLTSVGEDLGGNFCHGLCGGGGGLGGGMGAQLLTKNEYRCDDGASVLQRHLIPPPRRIISIIITIGRLSGRMKKGNSQYASDL
jgi:hypothetical protein